MAGAGGSFGGFKRTFRGECIVGNGFLPTFAAPIIRKPPVLSSVVGPFSLSMSSSISALQTLLAQPKQIVITTHHKPDADALGSSLAWAGYLKQKGHHVTVVTPSDYPAFLNWMEGNDEVVVYDKRQNDRQVRDLITRAEVICCLDFSCLGRIN